MARSGGRRVVAAVIVVLLLTTVSSASAEAGVDSATTAPAKARRLPPTLPTEPFPVPKPPSSSSSWKTFVQEVLVPDDSGVITQIISSPVKHIHVDARARRVGEEQVHAEQDAVDGSQFAISQVSHMVKEPTSCHTVG
ncbi:hypothetical protein ZWY2020_022417 [Hordeum vulgare]|nr:hypothetical protein ZWY2020_022417 [Hordeum vulgare]